MSPQQTTYFCTNQENGCLNSFVADEVLERQQKYSVKEQNISSITIYKFLSAFYDTFYLGK